MAEISIAAGVDAGLSHPLSTLSAIKAMSKPDRAVTHPLIIGAALHFWNETPIACSNATSPARN